MSDLTPLRLVQQAARQRPERAIQRAVLDVLRAHGILAWGIQRERAGRSRASHIGFPGHPDIAGVLPGGRAMFIEVKRPGGKVTKAQSRAAFLLAQQGAAFGFVHSVDEARALLTMWGLRGKG